MENLQAAKSPPPPPVLRAVAFERGFPIVGVLAKLLRDPGLAVIDCTKHKCHEEIGLPMTLDRV